MWYRSLFNIKNSLILEERNTKSYNYNRNFGGFHGLLHISKLKTHFLEYIKLLEKILIFYYVFKF